MRALNSSYTHTNMAQQIVSFLNAKKTVCLYLSKQPSTMLSHSGVFLGTHF